MIWKLVFRLFIKKHKEKINILHAAFIELEKAYDLVLFELICGALRKICVKCMLKLLKICKAL